MAKIERSISVPVWEKMNLTLEEAAAYTGVGICKLRELSNEQKCTFVLRVGSKRLFKRKELEDYLNKVSSV